MKLVSKCCIVGLLTLLAGFSFSAGYYYRAQQEPDYITCPPAIRNSVANYRDQLWRYKK